MHQPSPQNLASLDDLAAWCLIVSANGEFMLIEKADSARCACCSPHRSPHPTCCLADYINEYALVNDNGREEFLLVLFGWLKRGKERNRGWERINLTGFCSFSVQFLLEGGSLRFCSVSDLKFRQLVCKPPTMGTCN